MISLEGLKTVLTWTSKYFCSPNYLLNLSLFRTLEVAGLKFHFGLIFLDRNLMTTIQKFCYFIIYNIGITLFKHSAGDDIQTLMSVEKFHPAARSINKTFMYWWPRNSYFEEVKFDKSPFFLSKTQISKPTFWSYYFSDALDTFTKSGKITSNLSRV